MRRTIGIAAALLLLGLVLVPVATAKTVRASWTATIGSFGTATVYAYTDGTGGLALRLSHLTHDARYNVGLYRGTCAKPVRWLTFPAVVASSTGTVTRGFTLKPSQIALARQHLKSGLVARVGSRCGPFSLSIGTASPVPTPTSSVTASAAPGPSQSPGLNPCTSGTACLGTLTTISLPSGATGSIGPQSASWVSASDGALVTVGLRGSIVLTRDDLVALAPLLAGSPVAAGAVGYQDFSWDNVSGSGSVTFKAAAALVAQPMWFSLQGTGGRLWWLLVSP